MVKTPWETVQSFILAARAGMPNNPYHNWTHVVDVTQVLVSRALPLQCYGVLENIRASFPSTLESHASVLRRVM